MTDTLRRRTLTRQQRDSKKVFDRAYDKMTAAISILWIYSIITYPEAEAMRRRLDKWKQKHDHTISTHKLVRAK